MDESFIMDLTPNSIKGYGVCGYKDVKRVVLRDILPQDTPDYRRWFTIETEWMRWDAPWEKVDDEKFIGRLTRMLDREPPAVRRRFEIDCDGKHIGWVSSYFINGDKDRLAIGINIPEKDCWGGGLGRQALEQFIRYLMGNGFSTLYCQTWSGNVRMVRLANSLGFKIIDSSQTVRIDGAEYQRLVFQRKE